MMTLFGIIFAILFFILAYKKIDWAIYTFFALLPTYLIRFSFFGLPSTLLEIMLLAIFVAWIAGGNFKWDLIRKNTFFWPIVAIIIFATIAVFISPNFIKALGLWRAYFIEPILFYFVLISVIKEKRQLYNILWAIGFSVLYIGIYAIYQKFTGLNVSRPYLNKDGSVDRVVSIYGYPNGVGLYLGPIILAYTAFLWQKTKTIWPQILKFIILAVGFISILLSQSEAAVLSVLVLWIIFGLIFKKTRLYAGAIIFIGLALFFTNPALRNFIIEKLTLNDYSGFVRRLMWGETWRMLKDHWLWGAGIYGYQKAILPYHLKTFEVFLYPHNFIFNFWSELGVMGLLSFLWLGMVFVWKNLVAIFKKENWLCYLGILGILIQIVIQGLVDVPYFRNDLAIMFWAVIAGYSIVKNFSTEK